MTIRSRDDGKIYDRFGDEVISEEEQREIEEQEERAKKLHPLDEPYYPWKQARIEKRQRTATFYYVIFRKASGEAVGVEIHDLPSIEQAKGLKEQIQRTWNRAVEGEYIVRLMVELYPEVKN